MLDGAELALVALRAVDDYLAEISEPKRPTLAGEQAANRGAGLPQDDEPSAARHLASAAAQGNDGPSIRGRTPEQDPQLSVQDSFRLCAMCWSSQVPAAPASRRSVSSALNCSRRAASPQR